MEGDCKVGRRLSLHFDKIQAEIDFQPFEVNVNEVNVNEVNVNEVDRTGAGCVD